MKNIILKYLTLLDIDSIEKRIVLCSNYPIIQKKIPDNKLILESVFSEDNLEEIFNNFQPYLDNNSVCPIIEVLGGNVICLGFSEVNEGKVYYFDLDFGLYELDQTIEEFKKKLIH